MKIVRIDMKNAKKYTEKMKKPFDDIFDMGLQYAMYMTCKETPGCKLAYKYSDKIDFLIDDSEIVYAENTLNSHITSFVVFYFTHYLNDITIDLQITDNVEKSCEDWGVDKRYIVLENMEEVYDYHRPTIFHTQIYDFKSKKDIIDYFQTSQRAAEYSSMYENALMFFKDEELENLAPDKLQHKLFKQGGVCWSDLPTYQKRGSWCYRGKTVEDRGWNIEVAPSFNIAKLEEHI